jgi:DDE superfamily endonuclease
MEPQPEADFPATLGRWVGEIVLSIPQPARRTVAELIMGGLLAGGGHVTQACLALTPRRGWQAYHWMLERGRFRLLGLVTALCGIVRREAGMKRRFAVIDDTLAPRASAKAPGAAVRFDHAHKTNRPAFLLCQSFVTLGTVVTCPDQPRCVPIITGVCRGTGNAGKIALAKTLLRAGGDCLGPLCLLLDAWYMRASLIRMALRRGHDVVGQVRRDTALCGLPPPRAPGRRGRPRRYGERIDAAAAALLPASTHRIAGYGGRAARLRHVLCRPRFLSPLPVPASCPRFLHGIVVHAVWCELAKRHGGWAKQRLLLSTDPNLSASAVVEAYANRWTVEPLFAALKLTDGMGAMWQRGRTALLRWLHLVQIGRALLILLTARAEPQVLALLRVGGWRKATTLTPGLVQDALARRCRAWSKTRLPAGSAISKPFASCPHPRRKPVLVMAQARP